MPTLTTEIPTAAAALLAVLGLIWLIARLFQTKESGAYRRASARLKIEARTMIDAKRHVILLRCDRQSFLILTGPAGDTLLGSVDASGPEQDA